MENPQQSIPRVATTCGKIAPTAQKETQLLPFFEAKVQVVNVFVFPALQSQGRGIEDRFFISIAYRLLFDFLCFVLSKMAAVLSLYSDSL